MKSLDGKVCLITGGSSGIGLASAAALLRQGARVAITGRGSEALEAAGAELGPNALTLTADAGDRARMAAVVEEVAKAFGRLDFLFLNAGMAQVAPISDTDEERFDQMMATNLRGPYFTARDAFPHLNDDASVLFNVTAAVTRAWAMTSAYVASKAGLSALARVLAAEFGVRGIRVNTISPGVVETAIHGKLGIPKEQLAAMTEQMVSRILLARTAAASEIADVVAFLASHASRYITAEEIRVDGGISRS